MTAPSHGNSPSKGVVVTTGSSSSLEERKAIVETFKSLCRGTDEYNESRCIIDARLANIGRQLLEVEESLKRAASASASSKMKANRNGGRGRSGQLSAEASQLEDEAILLRVQRAKLLELSEERDGEIQRLQAELRDAQAEQTFELDMAQMISNLATMWKLEKDIRDQEDELMETPALIHSAASDLHIAELAQQKAADTVRSLQLELEQIRRGPRSEPSSPLSSRSGITPSGHYGSSRKPGVTGSPVNRSHDHSVSKLSAEVHQLEADVEAAENTIRQNVAEAAEVGERTGLTVTISDIGATMNPDSPQAVAAQMLEVAQSEEDILRAMILLLKPLLFNLYEDYTEISDLVAAVLSDPLNDDSVTYRQDSVTQALTDVKEGMESGACLEEFAAAAEFVDKVKRLLVVCDLFEYHLGAPLLLCIVNSGIGDELAELFTYAEAAQKVVAEEVVRVSRRPTPRGSPATPVRRAGHSPRTPPSSRPVIDYRSA